MRELRQNVLCYPHPSKDWCCQWWQCNIWLCHRRKFLLWYSAMLETKMYFPNLHFLLFQMLFQFFCFSPPKITENVLTGLRELWQYITSVTYTVAFKLCICFQITIVSFQENVEDATIIDICYTLKLTHHRLNILQLAIQGKLDIPVSQSDCMLIKGHSL